MATENGELTPECFLEHSGMETVRMKKIKKQTKKVRREARVLKEVKWARKSISIAYHYVIKNTIIINIIWWQFNIFINDNPKINSLPEITTSTTIYADDVQLLFSGTPNNLSSS